MHYLILSFSHKNSTLTVREKLAFTSNEQQLSFMDKLNANAKISESMVLSTCNRVEIFCSCSDLEEAEKHILFYLSDHSKLDIHELRERGDIFEDHHCIHHLFSVASSLDSMVIGETQISGQLKEAFKLSQENGYSGVKLSRAMQWAQKCAAEVRNASDISSRPVSVASVAVSKAKEKIGSLEGIKALVIGSGEMSVITCKHLSAQGADVTIMNRTFEKAESIAEECGAMVRSFEEILYAVNEYELLFTSTGSINPIIEDEMVKGCSFRRYWFDMAVPRDIECDASNWDIDLYRVDDLKEIVTQNISLREDQARLSFGIVNSQTNAFFEWLKGLSIEPLIKSIYEQAYACAAKETQRVLSKGFIPKEYEKQLQKAAEQSLKTFLHPIAKRMRESTDPLKSDSLIEAMNFLTDQDEKETPPNLKSYKGN